MPPFDPPRSDAIRIRGARQNNLKESRPRPAPQRTDRRDRASAAPGKSSLVFDTLYAEGQRRYVETFSPYARQFLDRMDKPQVDRIEGIPPAIAIDQTNPVRTSRSTVGTMTELNDHLKLLFARAAVLHCRGCGQAGAARHAREHSRALLSALARDARRSAAAADLSGAHPEEFHRGRNQGIAGRPRLHAHSRKARRHPAGDSGSLSLVRGRAGARRRCHRSGAQGRPGPPRRLSGSR